MSPKFHKHRLLLDEGLYPRKLLSRTNNRHNVRHIKHDLHREGISDKDVYAIAVAQNRIVITYNSRDFKKLVKQSNKAGVIGVTQRLIPDNLDKRLNSMLSKSPEKTFYGKYTSLSKWDK